eukprot:gnl/Spiro4/8106_TR4271_c0_g1_i1.p1 gnl/Spiro4/8106_TR4271_c0_g1~~gnl/Spiro4/8106_TR4271_c0_g1_i1.p1  ORF type:complete len:236 (+),score=63.81 gnl/Spiro4/8106_TR4271_c0_g1_i1:44-709(+)
MGLERAPLAKQIASLATATACVLIYFGSNRLIEQAHEGSGFRDVIFEWTTPLNLWLKQYPEAVKILSTLNILGLDLIGFWLVGNVIWYGHIRFTLTSSACVVLRQVLMMLVRFPLDPHQVWSAGYTYAVFTDVHTDADYFFSGHACFALLSFLYFFFRPNSSVWEWAMCLVFLIFTIGTMLVLHIHYTADIYAGLMTGLAMFWLVDMQADFRSDAVKPHRP